MAPPHADMHSMNEQFDSVHVLLVEIYTAPPYDTLELQDSNMQEDSVKLILLPDALMRE